MIAVLNLSIFVILASFIKANYDHGFSKDSGCCSDLNVFNKKLKVSKEDLKYNRRKLTSKKRNCQGIIRRLKKQKDQLKIQNNQLQIQNEELQSIIQELEADGEWGSWSGWSACRSSSFCGRGFTTRSRSCTPPGKYCEGDTVEVETCDNGQCPSTGLKKKSS